MVVKMAKVNYLGLAISIATFASFLLPWWSVRALGVSVDIYPYGVRAWNVWSDDWVVNRLLTLNGAFLIVGTLVVVSVVLSLAGSLKLPPLLITPAVLNLLAALIFYELMRSAIGKLAHGPFSGTNLIPAGPWGFGIGIGLCILAGLAAPITLILSYLTRP